MLLSLSVSLIIGVVLVDGCTGNETQMVTETQIIEVITPKEAFNMIESNRNNPDFFIIDIRTPEEFAEHTDLSTSDIKGYIGGAINIDYYSATFKDELNSMDKNNMYLIYGQQENRSGATLVTMEELNFKEVYDIKGGIEAWRAEGLPVMG